MKNLLLLSVFVPLLAYGQFGDADKKLVVNGYVVNMQSVSISPLPIELPDSLTYLLKGDQNLYNTNIYFQNRLNAFWYVNSKLTVSMQMRNRLLIGDQVRLDFNSDVENNYRYSGNFFNPSWNISVGNSYILNLAFDRLYAEYVEGDFEFTVGKQRINWGKTFAFNPNDLFNTYSYFDFDYEEKPGTDAFRAIYYNGMTSSLELAANIDSAANVTAAVRWNTNMLNYDFQLIGGVLKDEDLAFGLGWSGYIGGASWRGEFGYYHPFKNFSDTVGLAMLSTGADFSINAKWMVQAEAMIAKLPEGRSVSFSGFYTPAQSVKDIAIAPFQLLGSVSYQASPLSTLSLSSIWYPHKNIKGVFIGPSWSYSLANNMTAAIYWQFFHGKIPDSLTNVASVQNIHAGYLRLKYSF